MKYNQLTYSQKKHLIRFKPNRRYRSLLNSKIYEVFWIVGSAVSMNVYISNINLHDENKIYVMSVIQSGSDFVEAITDKAGHIITTAEMEIEK